MRRIKSAICRASLQTGTTIETMVASICFIQAFDMLAIFPVTFVRHPTKQVRYFVRAPHLMRLQAIEFSQIT
jgi:hypothetical protein